MMCNPKTIAIDGPAASGKSTIGRRLAEDLDYLYLDTGLMYRAVTWKALQNGVEIRDEGAVSALAEEILIDVRLPARPTGREVDIHVDGQDVTDVIHSPAVDANVSVVAAYSGVRAALTRQQRRIGARGQVVMVGRDIGTVVLPDAELKIYLDASVEERARRRFEECMDRGEQVTYSSVLDSMKRRDRLDSSRTLAPLRPAESAIILDSDHLNIEEVITAIRELMGGCDD